MYTYTIGNSLNVSIHTQRSAQDANVENTKSGTVDNSSQILHVSDIIVVRAPGRANLGENLLPQARRDSGVHREEVDDERHGGSGCVAAG